MKLFEVTTPVSHLVKDGRIVEFIGLGKTIKGTRFQGRNVRTGANVPAGSQIGYTLREDDKGVTTLEILYHRPGKVYHIVKTAKLPLAEAAKSWEIEGYDVDCDLTEGHHVA